MLKQVHTSMLAAVTITTLLATTNPNEERYAKYMAWQLQSAACEKSQRAVCETLKVVPPGISESVLKNYIYRQNFGVFSLYQFNFWGVQVQSIGIAGQFFSFESSRRDRTD